MGRIKCERCGKRKDRTRAVKIVSNANYVHWICRDCVAETDQMYIYDPLLCDEVGLTGYIEFEDRQDGELKYPEDVELRNLEEQPA